jgi:hypothetical protein
MRKKNVGGNFQEPSVARFSLPQVHIGKLGFSPFETQADMGCETAPTGPMHQGNFDFDFAVLRLVTQVTPLSLARIASPVPPRNT